MAKVFVVDVGRCSGCYNCQLACKDEHVDNDWRPYAAPQPETGHFWLKLDEHVCGTIPKVKIHYIARLCNHFENPACMAACPADAMDGAKGYIHVVADFLCTRCGACIPACPESAIVKTAGAAPKLPDRMMRVGRFKGASGACGL